MKNLVRKVFGYDKKQRLARLCELLPKQLLMQTHYFEDAEIIMIQEIRRLNGEHEKILKEREQDKEFNK